jgi:hypothetical protein
MKKGFHMESDESSKREHVIFNAEAVSILQLLIDNAGGLLTAGTPANSASVKFMITLQDEADLNALGYTQKQIHRITPQEAADIIQAGKRSESAKCEEELRPHT